MTTWIKCENAPPEEGKFVLLSGYAYCDPKRGRWVKIGARREDCYHDEDEAQFNQPTHWQPLPEPPAE